MNGTLRAVERLGSSTGVSEVDFLDMVEGELVVGSIVEIGFGIRQVVVRIPNETIRLSTIITDEARRVS